MSPFRFHFASCLAIIASTAVFAVMTPAARAQNGGNGLFLSTYRGPTVGTNDLLVNSATALYTGSDYIFTAVLGAPVGTTIGAYYVWGVNRGAGTAGFAALGATQSEANVLFDTVIVAHPVADTIALSPSLAVNRLAGGGSTVLPAANMAFSGNTLTLTIPASALPSTGFAPQNFTANLWPRFEGSFNGSNVTGNAQISQFAPDNANFQVTAAPEPVSLALVGFAAVPAGAMCFRRLRRRAV